MHARGGRCNRGLAVLDVIIYGSGDGFGYGYGFGYGDGYGVSDGYGSISGDGYGSVGGSVIGSVNDYEVITCDPFQYLKIGCEIHTVDWWLSNWEATAEHHVITVDQATVEEIKRRIK